MCFFFFFHDCCKINSSGSYFEKTVEKPALIMYHLSARHSAAKTPLCAGRFKQNPLKLVACGKKKNAFMVYWFKYR